ncbi:MAG: hypothetical protein LBT97_03080 [Planctomycetota bacterium]|jgi:hypothetical protein|nr:hypothetical protein [Planctomycetota bacterium]
MNSSDYVWNAAHRVERVNMGLGNIFIPRKLKLLRRDTVNANAYWDVAERVERGVEVPVGTAIRDAVNESVHVAAHRALLTDDGSSADMVAFGWISDNVLQADLEAGP